MVSTKKKEVNGKIYYYLNHTYRKNGKIIYKEKYLGSKLPDNMDQITQRFINDIYKEKWFGIFEMIKKGYSKELKKMPYEVLKRSIESFMVLFTYNTNRIEGSELSFKDTAIFLEYGITPKNIPIADIKEAEAHRKVFYDMLDYNGALCISIMLEWHKELFKETKPEIAGKIRDYQVYIVGTHFIPPNPLKVQTDISKFFRWYNKERNRLNPVELAALTHLKFESIHPFGDGNGRIGRLIMNFILHKNGYPMLNIAYTNRKSYYNALERSNIKKSDYVFASWFFRRYLKEYKRYTKF